MKLHRATRDVAREALGEVLASAGAPADAWAWLRWSTGARLSRLGASSKLADCFTGRVFWGAGELRWVWLERTVRVVYLGENATTLEGGRADVIDCDAVRDDALVLQHIDALDLGAMPELKDETRWAVVRRDYMSHEHGSFERFVNVTTRSLSSSEGRHAGR